MEWLLKEAGADPNPIDRFNRTPLEVRHALLAKSQQHFTKGRTGKIYMVSSTTAGYG